MTKFREPGTYADAVTKIMGVLTPDGAAEAVGKSVGLIRRWSDPDDPTMPNIEQAEQLDRAYIEATDSPVAPLKRVYMRRVAVPSTSMLDPKKEVVEVAQAATDMCGEAWAALKDGVMTPAERRALKTKIENLLNEGEDALKALEQPAVKGAA